MTDTDFILKWIEELELEIDKLPFQENDIRKDFYGLLFSIGNEYYRGKIFSEFSSMILDQKIMFSDKTQNFQKHIKKAVQVAQIPLLRRSHTNNLNRNLIINTWSTFELCVTTLCEAIATEEERSHLLQHRYRDIKRCLKGLELSALSNRALLQHTSLQHLTHVAISRKTDFLFKKAINYYQNVEEAKEFLIFFGKMRNTLHTNFIYYGKDYEYTFGHANFIFTDGKLVKWIDPFEPSPKLYFYIVNRLKEIWKILTTVIKHDAKIEYPDLDQE